MDFPNWVNSHNPTPLQLRSNQLRFLILNAALLDNHSVSVSTMVKDVCSVRGVETAIRRGYFTRVMAGALENKFGPELLNKDFLSNRDWEDSL